MHYSPEAEDLEWVDHAACAGTPVDAFFVDAGRIISDEVLALCHHCPVRRECLTYAYGRGFSSGYFGGLSPSQRRELPLEAALDLVEDTPAS